MPVVLSLAALAVFVVLILRDKEISKWVKLLSLLYVADVFIPDVLPFADEALMALILLLSGKGKPRVLSLLGLATEVMTWIP